ncbi:MAG TPA: hypothetical protein DCF62_14345 [Porticoccaceae bacterium]|nr:hypothetical protein [Porticoccaceae bacterium]
MKMLLRTPRLWLSLALSPILLLSALTGAAPAPIEEIGGNIPSGGQVTQSGTPVYPQVPDPADTAGDAVDDPYYRNQMLLEEIRQLRGLVEEQGNALARLKKQQREDYLDLDRRLSALVSTGVPLTGGSGAGAGLDTDGSATASAAGAAVTADQPLPSVSGDDSGAQVAYDRAYALLKERKTHDAKIALKQYINDYPASAYSANAHYWMGELHLLDGELPQAEQQFKVVVDKYPAHRKVSDATFKLGKVYHLQGKNDLARAMLERAALGSDSAARLAQDYLLQNY